VAPHLQSDLSYDPLVDLAPITLISVVPSILAVHPSVPVTTVQELIDYAKAHPGELTFGSSGPGGSGHLAGEMFKTMAGVDMLHIPYTGTGPATQALIAGEVDVLFGNMISLLPQVEAGTVRAIALSTPERSPLVPDLPTVSETVPGYAAGPWYGLLAPGGTPPDIIAKLNAEVVAILKSPEMSQRLSSEGAEPSGNTPEEFAAFLREETDRWGKVVAEAGITAD
jgi:tripartite-type tricarboxylate transporter receptor subunit TctC